MADRKIAVRDEVTVTEEIQIEEGSGNVFEDLGLPNADERLAKAQVAMLLHMAIEDRGLSQRQAARILGLNQGNLSRLVSGRLSGFTLERLFRFLRALGMDIEVTVKRKPERMGQGRLVVHAIA